MEKMVGESLSPWGQEGAMVVMRGPDGPQTLIFDPEKRPTCTCKAPRCDHVHFVVSLFGAKDPNGPENDGVAAAIVRDDYKMKRFVLEQLLPRMRQGVDIWGYSITEWWRIHLEHY